MGKIRARRVRDSTETSRENACRIAKTTWDVVVVGGGNAALVAAISARELSRKVLMIERAPKEWRGGNSRHTRNLRCVHSTSDAYSSGAYPYEEFWSDLSKVGTGPNNTRLASLTLTKSEEAPQWMTDHGVRWQQPLTGTLHLGRTNRFFLGGGKALINSYYRTASKLGIEVLYEGMVEDLEFEEYRCTKVNVEHLGDRYRISSKAIVCASGGFEANLEWLKKYWGDAASNYYIRGPKYNDGTVLKSLLEHTAKSAGDEKGFHAVAVDARSPRFDGGIATRLDTIPFSIVVNKFCKRFYDEGEELWPKRYAIWGRNIAEQPDQLAYSIWDSKVSKEFIPPMYGPTVANTIEELAASLGIDETELAKTVHNFNSGVISSGLFDPTLLDKCSTTGVTPPKSNWAQKIDTPPYFGIAMRPGITFTYLGVEVNEKAQIVTCDNIPFTNVFAAGEIMSGNILSTGYLAGFGLTIGTVWGRIAGEEAARVAQ